MVLLDLQAMKPEENDDARQAFGHSVDNSGVSILLCHDDD
ncbi:SapB/AmfS family lanthipeptide [Streptomyces griseocarneus]|nr:SapB/AmfS family lanthipeptide [Streptomyces griseocarneus]MBZ6476612.1 SapB/AmfS family lanthipeptide [Streptomyces griseocarneus]GHG79438.1 hypothetical protein GCM10018779_60150 [Streptomyces griseocarneus]